MRTCLLKQYDRILFHPKNAIPVDFEQDNQLFVVPVDDVVAVFRRWKASPKRGKKKKAAKRTGCLEQGGGCRKREGGAGILLAYKTDSQNLP